MRQRIAFVAPNLQSGGSERILSRLSVVFSKKYDVDILLFDGSKINYSYSGKLIDLHSGTKTNKILNIISIIKRVIKYIVLSKKNKYTAVFAFTSSANKIVRYTSNKTRVFYSCRGYEYLSKNYDRYHRMLSKNKYILFNSIALKEFYVSKYKKDYFRTYVVHNLFDNNYIIKASEDRLSDKEEVFFNTHKTVLSVSHFSLPKSQWNILKAFELLKEKVPDAGLVFVGNRGELEQNIHKMAASSKYTNDILFVGYSNNPYKYMSKADIFVLPSNYEGFPNVLVEAMLCGAPVVSTDCMTGPREILCEHYDNKAIPVDQFYEADYGVLVPTMPYIIDFSYNNVTTAHSVMAAAMAELLLNQELRTRYITSMRKRAVIYDESIMINKYFDLVK